MPTDDKRTRKRPTAIELDGNGIENDRTHHFAGPFLPQTPLGSLTPERSASPSLRTFQREKERSILIRWVIKPAKAFQLLLLPLVFAFNWKFVATYLKVDVPTENPFTKVFLLQGRVPGSTPDDVRYQKTWWDLAFLAYYIVFFSMVRQIITINISRPIARYFGLRRSHKIERFGEQFYAVVYFTFFGAWGYRIMRQLPTYWYNTQGFWIDYPHWDMKPELKAYYLLQFSYWCQQLLVLMLQLEQPRKDYAELVAHHFVTLWLVGWSYIVNLTYIGNAVFMSMDIPDTFLAFSKMLNYIQWNTAKVYSFGVFFAVWTYFRHYLNIVILWSVAFEQPSVPEWTKVWDSARGIYMPWWMQSQIFIPLFLLQCINLFWYRLMVRILYRALVSTDIDDDRSDDEGDDDEPSKDKSE